MKLTYTDIKNAFFRKTGNNSSNTNILDDFKLNLSQRYQLTLSKINSYVTQTSFSDTTVASTQYYPYPAGMVRVENAVITIGSFRYPLTIINAQHNWDILNAIQIQASAIPQFIYPRGRDYGIWPIPQSAYPITFNYYPRDHALLVEDETTGTISVTTGDATVTGSGTAFTAGMVGRWLQITDTSATDYGYWYKVLTHTDATHIELDTEYQGSTLTGLTYRIGQVPSIPDEGHIILVDGVVSDFYSGQRNAKDDADWYENRFWTGDGRNPSRKFGDDNVTAGLIGLENKYKDRDQGHLVNRRADLSPIPYKVFATTLS